MHPAISIGAYMTIQMVILFLIRFCLRSTKFFENRKSGFSVFFYTGACCHILVSLFPVLGSLLPDSKYRFMLQAVGNIWLGFILYFNGILILLCVFLWICCLLKRSTIKNVNDKHRRGTWYFTALCVSFASALLIFIYGLQHAQNTKVKEYTVNIAKDIANENESDNNDLTIVLIADFHLGVNSHLSTIQRMVNLVNEQHADVVLVAGDIFNSSYNGLRQPGEYAEVLSQIKAKYGVYAVYGNHDVEETLFGGFNTSSATQSIRTEEMEQFFSDSGFTVLYDETVLIDDTVQIIGRIDGEKAGDGTANREDPASLLSGIDRTRPVIVLEHEPIEFAALKENGADLVLCGHTHAGQIFPGNLIVPFFNENGYGYRVVNGLDTIVTAGVGYYGPPMRVGTDSEVTVVHVHFNKAA